MHSIYELIERDAFANFSRAIQKDNSKLSIIDSSTSPTEIQVLLSRFREAGIDVYILYLPSCIAVTSILCISLSDNDLGKKLQVNIGLGTSIDPVTAACRAITECAQARAALIHGAREDLYWPIELAQPDLNHASAMRLFIQSLIPDQSINWDQIDKRTLVKCNLEKDNKTKISFTLKVVSDMLFEAGHNTQFYSILTDSSQEFCVVKLFIPSLCLDGDAMGI